MFNFKKRSLSVRESPSRLSSISPVKVEPSPIKRIRLSNIRPLNSTLLADERSTIFQQTYNTITCSSLVEPKEKSSTVALRLDTPPLTPIDKIESKIEVVKRKNSELTGELKDLDQKIVEKFISIKLKREQIIELKSKHMVIEDFVDIAGKCQKDLRNLLNEIYYPGIDLAKNASSIFEEAKRNHEKKYEKMVFELDSLMEKSQSAAQNKIKQLTHEIALHQRTLFTIEVSKRHELSQMNDPEPQSRSEPKERPTADDDDCVIIDSGAAMDGVETPRQTGPEPSEPGTCEYDDDEKTDISSHKDEEEEEERSFTQCQAQKIN